MDEQPIRAALTHGEIDTLIQIVRGDNKQTPVWDGHIISSHLGRRLVDAGLAYHAYGYWHPSYEGRKWVKHLKSLFHRANRMPKAAITEATDES